MDYDRFRRDPVGEYLSVRGSQRTKRDDRQSEEKLNADAYLRGKLGTRAANDIIKTMDDLRSRGY